MRDPTRSRTRVAKAPPSRVIRTPTEGTDPSVPVRDGAPGRPNFKPAEARQSHGWTSPTPPQARMDRVARLTLALGGFMLVLLISLPFSLGDDAMSGTAPYILYSLFLTSIGIVIGVSLTWLNDPSRLPQAQSEENPTQAPMLSADESAVLEALRANGSMWQKELVESCGFTDSKASRVLTRMERAGLIRRVRDGMSKRVELSEGGAAQ